MWRSCLMHNAQYISSIFGLLLNHTVLQLVIVYNWWHPKDTGLQNMFILYKYKENLVILQPTEIITEKSKETRVVTYTCRYSSGYLSLIQLWSGWIRDQMPTRFICKCRWPPLFPYFYTTGCNITNFFNSYSFACFFFFFERSP